MRPQLMKEILRIENEGKKLKMPEEKKVILNEAVWTILQNTSPMIRTSEKNPPELMAAGRKWVKTRKIDKRDYSIELKNLFSVFFFRTAYFSLTLQVFRSIL